MRLLIADKFHAKAIEELRTLPLEIIYEPELTRESLESKLDGVGILIVRSTEVTAAAIDGAKQLNLIVRAGSEYHTIDVKAASRRGVYVANCPGKNASAVAELVFGMITAIDRRIPESVQSLRMGRWERTEFAKAEGLCGKRIGIAGLGAIGKEVAARAKSFGMIPLAWSRGFSLHKANELGVGYAATLIDLARKSDVLTIHLPLSERTRGIVNEKIFEALPSRAIFLNMARAGLVDYEALKKAVTLSGLRAALDVYPDEPKGKKEYHTDLFTKPASSSGGFVYGTPHIAASTDQAQFAIAAEAIRVIRSFLSEGLVPNVVNVLGSGHAKFQMIVRMVDNTRAFANVLAVIKRHGINVEEVTNTVFEGSLASCAKLLVVTRPSETCLQEIRAYEEVLHIDIIPLPNLA